VDDHSAGAWWTDVGCRCAGVDDHHGGGRLTTRANAESSAEPVADVEPTAAAAAEVEAADVESTAAAVEVEAADVKLTAVAAEVEAAEVEAAESELVVLFLND